ncbi:hypothetical protein BN940_08871 [Castellaniella defragrans 65Phen]|uniref:Uncharacterized protein n=1 Tax=Castellaniella defragrans (strain DSM 12143 / CCUG 39792 / 65Phen) TaxID=1437824 RepID=W8X3K6_CASD6|nr:hypothetical protein BN940_08871 [Castellaniella defragrans 65Phen]
MAADAERRRACRRRFMLKQNEITLSLTWIKIRECAEMSPGSGTIRR